MYGSVPTTFAEISSDRCAVASSGDGVITRASPKSMTFTWPLGVSMMLALLMSR